MQETDNPDQIFRNYLTKVFAISDSSWEALKPLLSIKSISKGEYIVKENQSYSNEIFLVSGIIRHYYLGTEGEEMNISFYKGEDTVCPLFTRNINGLHSCSIEALTDIIFIEFDAEKFNHLIRTRNDIQQYAYQIVERELKYKIEKEKLHLSQNAQIRLQSFRTQYKGLENEIPHYHIASYLGISPVSLSRLRKLKD